MIKEVMRTFEKLYKTYGDRLIYETSILPKGTYVIVNEDSSYQMVNIEGENDVISPQLYEELVKMNYLSSIISSNKPVDTKKTIHSNNYMSFFIKKENLEDKVVNDKSSNKSIHNAIDRYYSEVEKLSVDKKSRKKKDKEKLAMYEMAKVDLLDMDIERLEKNKSWVKENILELKKDTNYKYVEGQYLKIFFRDTEERYLSEYNRYLIPKIYNSNDYNVYIDNNLYGLPGDNMQLNAKKPYLEQLSRKNKCPILLNIDDALMQYKFFNYLKNFSINKSNSIYVDDEDFYSYEEMQERRNSFNGYLLKVDRKKTFNIKGYAVLMGYYPRKLNKEFNFENILNLQESEKIQIKYGKKTSLSEIHNLVDEIIFSNFLKKYYYTDDPKDIKIQNKYLKKLVMLIKDSMYNWFYKGKEKEGYIALKSMFISIISNSLSNKKMYKAKLQFNLLYSLMMYYENGGKGMTSNVKDARENLINKIDTYCNKDEVQYFDNDVEYYYSAGQIMQYLISLKNTSKPSQSDINMILSSKKDNVLKREIERLYRSYNHSKYINSRKFMRLYSMLLSYNPTILKVDTTSFLAGFLGLSIVRNKKEQELSEEATEEILEEISEDNN